MEKTILVIDDSPTMLRLIEYKLGKRYNVVSITDGLSGLLWLQDGNLPDLIVADIIMPNLDGFEFLKTLRSIEKLKDIPVIFLSVKGKSTDRVKGLKLGADDYMAKPFDAEELSARIENILRRITVRS